MDEIFVRLVSRIVGIAPLQNTALPLTNRLYGSDKRKIENAMFDTRSTSNEIRKSRYEI